MYKYQLGEYHQAIKIGQDLKEFPTVIENGKITRLGPFAWDPKADSGDGQLMILEEYSETLEPGTLTKSLDDMLEFVGNRYALRIEVEAPLEGINPFLRGYFQSPGSRFHWADAILAFVFTSKKGLTSPIINDLLGAFVTDCPAEFMISSWLDERYSDTAQINFIAGLPGLKTYII